MVECEAVCTRAAVRGAHQRRDMETRFLVNDSSMLAFKQPCLMDASQSGPKTLLAATGMRGWWGYHGAGGG